MSSCEVPLLGDLVGDLLAALVAGLAGLVQLLVERLALLSTTSRSSWAMSS